MENESLEYKTIEPYKFVNEVEFAHLSQSLRDFFKQYLDNTLSIKKL